VKTKARKEGATPLRPSDFPVRLCVKSYLTLACFSPRGSDTLPAHPEHPAFSINKYLFERKTFLQP
jgi:hypothetical protein